MLMLPLLLCACGSSRRTSSTKILQTADSSSTSIVETIRYDTVRLPGNIVTVVRRIECDTPFIKNVNLKLPKADTSTRGNVRLIITNLGNGTEKIECEADSLMAIIAAKDREINNYKSSAKAETIIQEEVVIKYRIPFWIYLVFLGLGLWNYRHYILGLFVK